jgi:hypothetical protein
MCLSIVMSTWLDASDLELTLTSSFIILVGIVANWRCWIESAYHDSFNIHSFTTCDFHSVSLDGNSIWELESRNWEVFGGEVGYRALYLIASGVWCSFITNLVNIYVFAMFSVGRTSARWSAYRTCPPEIGCNSPETEWNFPETGWSSPETWWRANGEWGN